MILLSPFRNEFIPGKLMDLTLSAQDIRFEELSDDFSEESQSFLRKEKLKDEG
jgi:hypothetical protein